MVSSLAMDRGLGLKMGVYIPKDTNLACNLKKYKTHQGTVNISGLYQNSAELNTTWMSWTRLELPFVIERFLDTMEFAYWKTPSPHYITDHKSNTDEEFKAEKVFCSLITCTLSSSSLIWSSFTFMSIVSFLPSASNSLIRFRKVSVHSPLLKKKRRK